MIRRYLAKCQCNMRLGSLYTGRDPSALTALRKLALLLMQWPEALPQAMPNLLGKVQAA